MSIQLDEKKARDEAAWWLQCLEKEPIEIVRAAYIGLHDDDDLKRSMESEAHQRSFVSAPRIYRMDALRDVRRRNKVAHAAILLLAYRHVRLAHLLIEQMCLYNLTDPLAGLPERENGSPYQGEILGRAGFAAAAFVAATKDNEFHHLWPFDPEDAPTTQRPLE